MGRFKPTQKLTTQRYLREENLARVPKLNYCFDPRKCQFTKINSRNVFSKLDEFRKIAKFGDGISSIDGLVTS